jgi:hypothetical protein
MKIVKCVKKGSELKVVVLGEEGNVQFPKDIREEGKLFAVENLERSGNFWKAKGEIYELLPVGKKEQGTKSSKTNKVLEIYSDESRAGETDFFFDGNQIIANIHGNDGNFRPEYFNCLFEHFDIQVKTIKKLTPEQDAAFVSYCKKNDIELSDFENNESSENDEDESDEPAKSKTTKNTSSTAKRDEARRNTEQALAALNPLEPKEQIEDLNVYWEVTENNDHEGESWSFFVKKDLPFASDIVALIKRYEFEEDGTDAYSYNSISTKKVKILMERKSKTTYMDEFNLVNEILHPSKALHNKKIKKFSDLNVEQIYEYLYKGGWVNWENR